MEKKRLEWRVGLFVFIGLAVLGVLLLQFSKGTSLFRPTYNLYLVADNAGGLKKSASVLMSGVQIGMVSAIHLNPQGTNVTITLRVFNEYVIHKDAQFLIEQSGFLGDQYVAVNPTLNSDGVFQAEDHAMAEPPFNLQEVARAAGGFLKRVDDTTKKLDEAIADVRRLLLNEETLTNLSTAVANLRVASQRAVLTVDNLNGVVLTNREAVAAALTNVVHFSEELDQLGTNFQAVIATNGAELATSLKNFESSTVVLKNTLDGVQAGQGLVGAVLKDEQLAVNVRTIAANLTITTSNLNHFGLWHFLWHKEPAKPNYQPQSNR
ncbi:MAG TPA: MlaD family protein [Verrucomicrobiae bacterium]|nr:MlaD family protein [Verrucomicrobiae bacterium]